MNKWKQWKHYENLLTENTMDVGRSDELTKTIVDLKNGRSPTELMKRGTEKLFNNLTWCINQYLNGTLIPSAWKMACIATIYHL